MFNKKPLPQAAPEPESETPAEKEHFPTMSGTFHAYQPQWKHRGAFAEAINKRTLKMEGGDDWTNVPFVVNRNTPSYMTLPDGRQVAVGVPFPRFMPGVLETIFLCGYEQAMALAYTFAAYVAADGGEVEVRAEAYTLNFDIKAKAMEEKKAA